MKASQQLPTDPRERLPILRAVAKRQGRWGDVAAIDKQLARLGVA